MDTYNTSQKIKKQTSRIQNSAFYKYIFQLSPSTRDGVSGGASPWVGGVGRNKLLNQVSDDVILSILGSGRVSDYLLRHLDIQFRARALSETHLQIAS